MKNKKLVTGCAFGALSLVIAALLIFWGVGVYNFFMKVDEDIHKQWIQLQNQFEKRLDLALGLLNYFTENLSDNEKAISFLSDDINNLKEFNLKSDFRKDYSGVEEFNKLQGNLGTSLQKIFNEFESYPEIKARESFMQLNANLDRIENSISVERKKYNDIVQSYNSEIKSFPSSLIARIFNLNELPYLR